MHYKTNELYHHGILGQKWGKKNGPPYPLSVSKHSASEKKAGWKSSLNKTSYESKFKRFINSKGFKVAMGVTVAVAVGYGAYTIGKSHMMYGPGKKYLVESLKSVPSAIDEYIAGVEKQYGQKGIFDPSDRKEMIEGSKENIREAVKEINLNYKDLPKAFSSVDEIPHSDVDYKSAYFNSKSKQAYKKLLYGINGDVYDRRDLVDNLLRGGERANNCMFCSAALAMRMKGFNVMASETTLGNLDFQFEKWFSGTKFKYPKAKTPVELFDALRNTGEGHYGAISVILKETGAGHSIFYTVKNGAVEIMDGQSGEFYGSTIGQLNKKLFSKISLKDTRFIDLTNGEPTRHILRSVMEYKDYLAY